MTEPDSSASSAAGSLVERLLASIDATGDRADILRAFAKAYVHRAPTEVLARYTDQQLIAQISGLLELAEQRDGPVAARAFNPSLDEHGYQTLGSVVETNCEDSPFLVDSLSEELSSHGLEVRSVIHPVVGTKRDEDGGITQVLHARAAEVRESMMHFEVNRRLTPDELSVVNAGVKGVLADVKAAVSDFDEMKSRVASMTDAASDGTGRYSPEEIQESIDFLQWLADGNFVFLGYREYVIENGSFAVVPDSGLGILSNAEDSHYATPVPLDSIDPEVLGRLTGGDLLLISKTNRTSTVHRRVKMDYVGVKRVARGGEVVGELRLLGLFTRKAYMEPASKTPILRRKLRQIVEAEDLIEDSHDYRAAIELYESFPKDELFAADVDHLRSTVLGLLDLQERRAVRLFVRRDIDGRRVAVVIALPRDRFNAELRVRLQELVRRCFRGSFVDYHLSLGESDPAQIHFTVHIDGEIPDVSIADLEEAVVSLARTWDDKLRDQLIVLHGEERGVELGEKYARRFPDHYKAARAISRAVSDIEQFERLDAGESFAVALTNEPSTEQVLTRIGLYKSGGKVPLSDFLPILERLGLRVVDEVPTRLHGGDGETFLHDFGVLDGDGRHLDLEARGELVADAITAVWEGHADSDSLNRLVVTAGLTWRQVVILRAYRKYRQRVGAAFTERYQHEAFANNPKLTAKLVRLFELRFDPDAERDEEAEAKLREEILAGLDAVPALDEDRILRSQLNLIDATVRTNALLPDVSSIAFKVDSGSLQDSPKPTPLYEIFVFSPRMEGIHLRGGRVARGGIRWSTRLEDYRTEILGLMKAQMVKNTVIVPVGSKGGFVLRRPPADPDELPGEVEAQYKTLIRGMLDLTDNLVDGEAAHPPGLRVYDDLDPYLVVAADKGTATFSDVANTIAAEYEFWLDDAFASGGTTGYDHKRLGITARGVWESVKRHFRELGHDVMNTPFTAIGIGDMSGDVFGNGLLFTDKLRLVAAFDHRHVFIDPDPDAATSFAERRRLFRLPNSSWDDYDRSLLSAGGGVWARSEKSILLSPEARKALDVEAGALTPNELISAILKAPVDLLWNGGIGTFVKSSAEKHADVGDRSNDGVRVDGRDVRAKVVGEGGNLGFTQRGRIEYDRSGGRINTDAIDNSAGVDTSDREVNLKILLSLAVATGELSKAERIDLLRDVEEDVARRALYDNYLQAQILSQEVTASPKRIESYEELMGRLEGEGLLDRRRERLPSPREMEKRRASKRRMARPELCVLLAYAKRSLKLALLDSPMLDDPFLDEEIRSYFPAKLVERFDHLISRHPLRRELLANLVANDVVDAQGITFVSRFSAETGAEPAEVVRAYWIAKRVAGARERWGVVESLDGVLDPATQNELMVGVDRLVEHMALWYLLNAPGAPIGETIKKAAPSFAELAAVLDRTGSDEWREARLAEARRLEELGVEPELAHRHAFQPELAHGPNIIAVAEQTGRPIAEVAQAFFLAGERLHIDWLEQRLEALPDQTSWQVRAAEVMSDDLMSARRDAAANVLANGAGPVADSVQSYLDSHVAASERLNRLISALSREDPPSLAALTVAIRQLRGLVTEPSGDTVP